MSADPVEARVGPAPTRPAELPDDPSDVVSSRSVVASDDGSHGATNLRSGVASDGGSHVAAAGRSDVAADEPGGMPVSRDMPSGDGDSRPEPAVALRARMHDLVVRRRLRLPGWLRFSRYTVGSAICFGVSEVVFVALFAPGLLGSKGAAIVASIAGIIPGYFLNRSWTWGRSGRSDFWREVVPYWATALISTALAALGTGAANALFADEPRGVRTLINAVAYMLVYGVLFLAKYVIFHRWLFAPPAASPADPA